METEKLPIEVDVDLLDANADGNSVPATQELAVTKTPLKEITAREASKAASELGLNKLAVNNLDAQTILGRYIEQSGAIRITTGEFMVSNSVRDELIQKCLLLTRKDISAKQLLTIGAFIDKLLVSKDNALKIINQAQAAGQIKPVQDPPNNRLPPRGAQVTPVQINNSNVTIGPKNE